MRVHYFFLKHDEDDNDDEVVAAACGLAVDRLIVTENNMDVGGNTSLTAVLY